MCVCFCFSSFLCMCGSAYLSSQADSCSCVQLCFKLQITDYISVADLMQWCNVCDALFTLCETTYTITGTKCLPVPSSFMCTFLLCIMTLYAIVCLLCIMQARFPLG